MSDNILQIFDALKFTEERYIRFDPDRSRISQLNFLFISQLTYQFSKITNSKTQRTIELASIFWKKAHEAMIQVTPINIIEHNRFSVDYLDFYIDLISHPDFDDEMQSKYLPD
ncbi:MAG: hypothetical protein HKP62_03970 [Sulfurovum sp.]|nr:hypothetical protein [Sulfurovum sp.]